jgi:hypothetical protein
VLVPQTESRVRLPCALEPVQQCTPHIAPIVAGGVCRTGGHVAHSHQTCHKVSGVWQPWRSRCGAAGVVAVVALCSLTKTLGSISEVALAMVCGTRTGLQKSATRRARSPTATPTQKLGPIFAYTHTHLTQQHNHPPAPAAPSAALASVLLWCPTSTWGSGRGVRERLGWQAQPSPSFAFTHPPCASVHTR